MTNKAIPDIVTIIGPSYFQPITDLVARMIAEKRPRPDPSGSGFRENGYAVSISILLVALLESFVARLRFCRNDELPGAMNIPDLLLHMFPDLPNHGELMEVFLVRNIILHNHIWNIDVRNSPESAPTLKSPHDLKTQTNKNYIELVDQVARKTKLMKLNASPVSIDRGDVYKIFKTVWDTLMFMNHKDFTVCPLSNDQVAFNKRRMRFSEIKDEIQKML
jgi:hypothetical protein